MKNKRFFNRIVLQHINDLMGVPQTFDDIHEIVQGRINRPSTAETQQAIDVLVTAGYIQRCEFTAADDPMWKITDRGMRQAVKGVKPEDLDPLIWG